MPLETISSNLFTWVDAAGTTRVLNADVVMNSEDIREAKPTEHTVEDGSVITDHIVILPEQVSFKLVVTQTPIRPEANFDYVADEVALNVKSTGRQSQDYPLAVRPSQFVPGGFLLISQGVRTVVQGVADSLLGSATGGAVGNSSFRGSTNTEFVSGFKPLVLKNTGGSAEVDRVNLVHSQLVEILNSRSRVTVNFKGRAYSDYNLLRVHLSEKSGKFGSAEIDVALKKIPTVDGETVNVPSPADFKAAKKKTSGNKKSKPKSEKQTAEAITLARRGATTDAAGENFAVTAPLQNVGNFLAGGGS